jgi:hypothetical protein
MGLSVDSRKVTQAWVVQWEPAPGCASGQPNATACAQWGVAYETVNGQSGADRIGAKAQAQAIVRDIASFGERPSNVSRIRG